MPAAADLHLHSRHSARSAEWVFRRFDFPDSVSDPLALYERLCHPPGQGGAAVMAFFTLTDHNTLDGCLAVAEALARREERARRGHTKPAPGAASRLFFSEQISTQFPEDHARVELLAWGVTEAQHRELQAARENIYDLQRLLAGHGILHAVAHPLHRLDDRLGLGNLEKLILLFRHFEGLNGLRHALLNETLQGLLAALTPAKLDELANRHNLAPTHAEPWRKILTGGSDDHGGLAPGAAWTTTPDARTVPEFLAHIREGRCQPQGKGGTPLLVSHGLYNTIYSFAREKFGGENGPHSDSFDLLSKVFSRFMEGKNPTEFSLTDKLELLAKGILSGKIFELAKPANASLWKKLAATFNDSELKALLARQTAGVEEPERRAFLIANLLVSRLVFQFFSKFVRELSGGSLIEALADLSALAPILLTVSPYLYAFQTQSPHRAALREMSRGLTGGILPALRNRKRAWFTDTLEDLNGVATTIRKMTAAGVAAGAGLVIVTCRAEGRGDPQLRGLPVKNFTPIGEFGLPEYELQKLSFPPILEMLDYIAREQFTELVISTPGPVGLTALLAARLLRLRTAGIYHTDFPQYIRILTDDSFLETLTWKYMRAFYSQFDLLYVNSSAYRRAWVERGIPESKIAILPRGLDTELFHPSRRDPKFWRKWAGKGRGDDRAVLLYVGRISKEKDLDVIVAALRKLDAATEPPPPFQMVFVGEGPYRAELERALPRALFTGPLYGQELATAYASADILLFPSTTDTYGNVVVEAHAAGLPTIVSDTGGPKELVRPGETGEITRSLDADDFARALRRLLADPDLRQRQGQAARKAVENNDWARAFGRFWAMSPE